LALDASRHRHAAKDKNPFVDAKSVDDGLEHYRENCLFCHGAPNLAAGEIAKGLNPPAPSLTTPRIEGLSDGELFWTVKNGIRMTGMPAFAPSHSDEEIWHIVAAMRLLGDLTPEQAAKLAAGKSGQEHHHEHGASEPGHAAGEGAGHDDHTASPAGDHHDDKTTTP